MALPGDRPVPAPDTADGPDGEPEPDGAEILRTLIADIYARRGAERPSVPRAPWRHADGGEEP